MSPEEAVSRAVEVFTALPAAPEAEVREMLLKRAIPPFAADQLMVVVPLAFSRAYFDQMPMEKQYWNDLLLVDRTTGKQEKYRLDWNPFYCAAQMSARKLAGGSPPDRDRLKLVAQRSLEYQAIDTILSQLPAGTKPLTIGTSEPTVLTDFPEPSTGTPYQSSVRFREAYSHPDGPWNPDPAWKHCALGVNLVIDAEHPIENEIPHLNECFLDWLARRGTECKQMVIAVETAPSQNEKILKCCERLLNQDLGMEHILSRLKVDLFLIDPVTQEEKRFQLAWRPEDYAQN